MPSLARGLQVVSPEDRPVSFLREGLLWGLRVLRRNHTSPGRFYLTFWCWHLLTCKWGKYSSRKIMSFQLKSFEIVTQDPREPNGFSAPNFHINEGKTHKSPWVKSFLIHLIGFILNATNPWEQATGLGSNCQYVKSMFLRKLQWVIHSFHKYLLSIYCLSAILVSIRESAVNKLETLDILEISSQKGQMDNN